MRGPVSLITRPGKTKRVYTITRYERWIIAIDSADSKGIIRDHYKQHHFKQFDNLDETDSLRKKIPNLTKEEYTHV